VPGVVGCASPYAATTAITVITTAMAASRGDGRQPSPGRAQARRTQPGSARLGDVGREVLTLGRVRPIGAAHQPLAMYFPGGMPMPGRAVAHAFRSPP
jgi:hypothetical protein